MTVQWWLKVLTVLGWPAMGVIVFYNPQADDPMRLVFTLATVVVPVATVLLLLPRLLSDHFRTYLLGYVNGCADTVEPEEDRPKLEIVR